MACTIVSTPALGASDWSTFITQVAGLKRGFMELSYTNFASTAESAIATGGVIEVAGSFYVFSETAIDYSTTTSANADLYIYAQPSAGGTNCTIVALTAAPAWRDDYQGFYASAASLNRAIGGMVVGTAGTYFHKWLYTFEHTQDCLERNATRPILRRRYTMGEWNMDATASINVTHDLRAAEKFLSIRAIEAVVWRDDNLAIYPIYTAGNISLIGSASVGVTRTASGGFDGVNFDGTASTVPNRGYVWIEFEA